MDGPAAVAAGPSVNKGFGCGGLGEFAWLHWQDLLCMKGPAAVAWVNVPWPCQQDAHVPSASHAGKPGEGTGCLQSIWSEIAPAMAAGDHVLSSLYLIS